MDLRIRRLLYSSEFFLWDLSELQEAHRMTDNTAYGRACRAVLEEEFEFRRGWSE